MNPALQRFRPKLNEAREPRLQSVRKPALATRGIVNGGYHTTVDIKDSHQPGDLNCEGRAECIGEVPGPVRRPLMTSGSVRGHCDLSCAHFGPPYVSCCSVGGGAL